MVIIGGVGTVVLMVVQNNLIGAFALLGAFSLIRFRTIVKETRDVAFIFFALAIGVAVGTNNYTVGLVATLLISVMIIALSRYGFGLITKESVSGFVLTFESGAAFEQKLAAYGVIEPLHVKHRQGKGGHYAYSVHFKDPRELDRASGELAHFPGIERFEFITSKHSVEY